MAQVGFVVCTGVLLLIGLTAGHPYIRSGGSSAKNEAVAESAPASTSGSGHSKDVLESKMAPASSADGKHGKLAKPAATELDEMDAVADPALLRGAREAADFLLADDHEAKTRVPKEVWGRPSWGSGDYYSNPSIPSFLWRLIAQQAELSQAATQIANRQLRILNGFPGPYGPSPYGRDRYYQPGYYNNYGSYY